MKRILILLIIALILAGGGGAAAYFFVPELLGIKQEVPAEAETPKPAPKPELVKPTTKHIPTFDVPLMIDGKLDRHIYFDVTLIVDPEHYTEVEVLMPRLQNAFIQFAYAAFPKQYREHGKMDLPKLRFSLKKIAQKTLGPEKVKDVLLQSYFER